MLTRNFSIFLLYSKSANKKNISFADLSLYIISSDNYGFLLPLMRECLFLKSKPTVNPILKGNICPLIFVKNNTTNAKKRFGITKEDVFIG
jgi:hypothetical protein